MHSSSSITGTIAINHYTYITATTCTTGLPVLSYANPIRLCNLQSICRGHTLPSRHITTVRYFVFRRATEAIARSVLAATIVPTITLLLLLLLLLLWMASGSTKDPSER
jgi:hypothetical protein